MNINTQEFHLAISGRCLKKLIYAVVIVFAFIIIISEHVDAKESGSSFLRISADATGAAMADAQGAMTGDVYAMYWNPAGLSDILFKEFGASYQSIFQGINYSFLGYATLTKKFGAVGGQVFFLSSGSITSTYENPDGSFGGSGSSFSVADLGIGFSQAKSITRSLSYGLSVKVLSHKIMDQQASSIAGDVGVIYQSLAEQLKVGVALQNFSTEYRFINEYLREPWNIRFSALYNFDKIPFMVVGDYNIISGYPNALGIGAEYRLFDIIALRAGLKLPPPSGLVSSISTGLGINLLGLYQLDYAVSSHLALGINQRFSLIVRF